ncbi:MAG: sigma 54-interacting transcriptional regulator [bacterium]
MDRPLTPTSDSLGSLLAADAFRAAEDHAGAIREYRRALDEADPLAPIERLHIRMHLADCLLASSDYQDAKAVLEPVLADRDVDPVERARALSRSGWADFFLGNVDSCRTKCEAAAAILLPTAHHDDVANTLRWLGYALRLSGDFNAALRLFQEALAAARRAGDPAQTASCLEAVGNLRRLQGRYEEAVVCHEESLRLHDERGSAEHVGKQHLHLALARLYSGDWRRAGVDLGAARRLFAQLGYERGLIAVDLTESRLLRRRGQLADAEVLASRALEAAQRTHYRRLIAMAFEELGDSAVSRGDSDGASKCFEQALAEGRDVASEGYLVYEMAFRLADVRREQNRVDEARALAEEALTLAKGAGDARDTGNALISLSLVRLAENRSDDAAALAEEAIELFAGIRAPFEQARAHEAAARIASSGAEDNHAAALGHLLQARRLYSRLGAVHDVTRIEAEMQLDAPSASGPDVPRDGIVAADASSLELLATVRDLAAFDSTVLLEGETGAGKEIIARLLHSAGPRRDRPFVALNCAAVAPNLLESELFGHRRGAFTGADRDHPGRLAAAADGTVLLDEIDKASLDFQAKLLRVIEDRVVHPVGSTDEVPLRARILCATNRDLRDLANEGRFLVDLYYRLSGLRLRIAPLRERPADLRVLADAFVRGCTGRFGTRRTRITKEAMRALAAYRWPGNVRELKNVLESAAFFARKDGVIRLEHLPPEIHNPQERIASATLPERIEQLERREIEDALRRTEGNKAEAARHLGVSRKGLLDRLRRLRIG